MAGGRARGNGSERQLGLVDDDRVAGDAHAGRALPGFRGACDIRVWLCQIAKNCFYTEQKRMGRIELLDSPVGAHFRVTLPLVWRTS